MRGLVSRPSAKTMQDLARLRRVGIGIIAFSTLCRTYQTVQSLSSVGSILWVPRSSRGLRGAGIATAEAKGFQRETLPQMSSSQKQCKGSKDPQRHNISPLSAASTRPCAPRRDGPPTGKIEIFPRRSQRNFQLGHPIGCSGNRNVSTTSVKGAP